MNRTICQWVALVTMALLLAMTTACKSDVDRVIDWYEETSPNIRRSLLTAFQCGRWENDYWYMVGLLERTGDRYAREYFLLRSQNMPESILQDHSDVWTMMIDSIGQGFLNSTGLTEQQSSYCGGRFEAERDPGKMCALFSKLPPVLPAPTSGAFARQYGAVEYCIENSIPPFH